MTDALLQHFESFKRSGIYAAAWVLTVWAVCLVAGLPFDETMALVIWLASWIAIAVSSRVALIRRDHELLKMALRTRAERIGSPKNTSSIEHVLTLLRAQSRSVRQLGDELLMPAKSLRSGVQSKMRLSLLLDETERDVVSWYGPISGLVWSLPAIGFLGTAWHLRHALSQLAITIAPGSATSNPSGDVAGTLGAAFLVMTVALGLSTIGHVGVVLAMKADLESVRTLRAIAADVVEAEEMEI